jgi:hypothetical protein
VAWADLLILVHREDVRQRDGADLLAVGRGDAHERRQAKLAVTFGDPPQIAGLGVAADRFRVRHVPAGLGIGIGLAFGLQQRDRLRDLDRCEARRVER